MTKHIEALIDKHHLTHLKTDILSSVFECVKVIPTKAEDAPIGSSKMGGVPDFPKSMEYPAYNGKPLIFLAQFNLEDIHKTGMQNDLPEKGMLYFFYFEDEDFHDVYGNPDAKDGWRVVFYDGPLEELEPADRNKFHYPQCRITFTREQKIPQIFIEDERDEDHFLQLLEELSPDNYDNHQVFGIPFSIQGEVLEEAEDYVNAKAEDITLLFQIDSDKENLDMMWGDSGMLYFCIANKDLRNRNFRNACCILQCL